MKIKFLFSFIFLISLLITFDALQQKYYVDTFQLSDEKISLLLFLINHSIRWFLWMVTSIPLVWLAWTLLKKTPHLFSPSALTKLVVASTATTALTLMLVSFESILSQGIALNSSSFAEFYLFYFFQKGLLFLLANGFLILSVHRFLRKQFLQERIVEISVLKKSEEELMATIRGSSSTDSRQLEIRIGNHIKTIPLEKIVWIQADDYCAKIHTVLDESYTIRKSLKSLEQTLSSFGFVRVHRGALLNLEYLDLINTQNSTIKLRNASEISASKNGIRSLRKRMAV